MLIYQLNDNIALTNLTVKICTSWTQPVFAGLYR